MEPNCRERKAYDTLKGVLYGLQVTDYTRGFLERELDLLYEAWYRLALSKQ